MFRAFPSPPLEPAPQMGSTLQITARVASARDADS